MTHPDLAGKAAIVTGAGAGIGLAIAARLADEGCRVLCADIDGDAADAAAQKIGRGAIGHRADVSDEEQVIGMVEACVGRIRWRRQARRQRRHRSFRAAHRDDRRGLRSRHPDQPAWRVAVHQTCGAARWSTAAAGPSSTCPRWRARSRRLVPSAYGMSKAGIIHLSRVTAAELRSGNVRSNAVLPAFVDTPMQQTAMTMFDEALGDGGADDDDRPACRAAWQGPRRSRASWRSCCRTTRRWSTAPLRSPTAEPVPRCGEFRLVRIDSAIAVISSATPA